MGFTDQSEGDLYGPLRSTTAQLTDAAAHMVSMSEITVSQLMTTKERHDPRSAQE